MNSEDNNQETSTESENGTGEGEGQSDTITISKSDYDKLNRDYGSLKRELKDLKKPKDEPKETPQQTKPDEVLLQRMEKLAFKQHSISHEDDVELARKTAQKWGMQIEDVLEDDDFQLKLKKQQDSRANIEAVSGVSKGDGSSKTGGKSKADFWINSNTPPSDDDVANHKIPKSELARIMNHFIKNKGSNKVFYND